MFYKCWAAQVIENKFYSLLRFFHCRSAAEQDGLIYDIYVCLQTTVLLIWNGSGESSERKCGSGSEVAAMTRQ